MSSLPPDLRLPRYDRSLVAVLPAVAASLGVPGGDTASAPGLPTLPPADRAVVVLVDGLGGEQLARRGGHAPFLRTLAPVVDDLTCGFPSTTATSLVSLGTGLTPGVHGVTGWHGYWPEGDRLVNYLSWDDGPDPLRWQPHGTVLERVARAGVEVTSVGQPRFAGSGLTRAGLRGGRFVGARTVPDRVEATLAAVRAARRALVYLYLGEVDLVGHTYGPDSWQWGQTVEEVDAALAEVARRLPPGTSLTVTADHGMVPTPPEDRYDLAERADLAAGVHLLAGEPRAPQPVCRPGAAGDVVATWREVLGERAVVLTREEAVEQGWFGPQVDPGVLPRIGDVVVAARGTWTVLDSRALRPEVLALRGHHGSLTPPETSVPLLHRPAP